MSELDALVIDGTTVRFVPAAGGRLRVVAGDAGIGSIEPVADDSGYVARGRDDEPVTRASQWGGRVTARFGSKELAVRALLARTTRERE
jgi:hypothetical protein